MNTVPNDNNAGGYVENENKNFRVGIFMKKTRVGRETGNTAIFFFGLIEWS